MATGVQKTDVNFLDPSRMGRKKQCFVRVWEKKSLRRLRQALDPWDMDPSDLFETAICTNWPFLTPSGLVTGGVYVEIEGLSSHELVFVGVLTTYNEK